MTVHLTIPELIGAAIGLAFGLVHMLVLRRAFASLSASYEANSRPVPTYLKLLPFVGPVVYTALGAYLATTIYGGATS